MIAHRGYLCKYGQRAVSFLFTPLAHSPVQATLSVAGMRTCCSACLSSLSHLQLMVGCTMQTQIAASQDWEGLGQERMSDPSPDPGE